MRPFGKEPKSKSVRGGPKADNIILYWKIGLVGLGEFNTKGPVKHVLLAKFKDGVSSDKIEQLIKGYANLVNLIEPMKAFHWGEDVSIENLHQGFTHIFESTFDSKEAVAEYVAHPVHVEFATMFLGSLDKVLVIDYKPTSVSF